MEIKIHEYKRYQAYCLCKEDGLGVKMNIYEQPREAVCPECESQILLQGGIFDCIKCETYLRSKGKNHYICPDCKSEFAILEKEIETISYIADAKLDDNVYILDEKEYGWIEGE